LRATLITLHPCKWFTY